MILTWIAVFSAVAALDFAWARYTAALTARNALPASLWAGVIILCSGSAAVGYTTDPWLLIPACFGAFVGTYIATRQHKENVNA